MYAKFFKRAIDFILSLVALTVLSPILLVLIIIGAVAMGGNPFFTQYRPGKIDKKTMSEIVCILSQFDEMINLQIQKTEKLKKQRKALQQYLLNGIVRV